MEIRKTSDNGVTELSLSGRLDTVTSPQLQTELEEALRGAGDIALDFADIAYVSSAGLRVLLAGEKTAKTSGKTMTLKNVSADVMEVFDMTGFSNILTIV